MAHIGSSIGGIIFPIMLNNLFDGEDGFKWGVRASAFFVLGVLVIVNLLITTQPASRPLHSKKPDISVILTDVPYMLANLS